MKSENTIPIMDIVTFCKKYPGAHYGHRTYKTKSAYINVTGSTTGCGLAQMYGVAYLNENDPENENVLNQIKKDYSQAGGIIATLGQSFKHKHKLITTLGFVKIAEYPNWHHDVFGNEIQSLYILFTKDSPNNKGGI